MKKWLALVLALAFVGCDGTPSLKAKPTLVITLQEVTATVTATWRRPGVPATHVLSYSWQSNRVSGGDNWNLSGSTDSLGVTFTVPRGQNTDAQGSFCVQSIRVSPDPVDGAEACVNFAVPKQVTVPPPAPDSLTIYVTDAATGRLIGQVDHGDIIFVADSPSVGDTTWLYSVQLASGSYLKNHSVGTSSTGHGLQLTAILWQNGLVSMCSGDCRQFPEVEVPGTVIDAYRRAAYMRMASADLRELLRR